MRNAEDVRMALVLSRALRVGVVLAVTAGVIGGALYLSAAGMEQASFHEFQGADVIFAHPGDVLGKAFTSEPTSLRDRGVSIAEVGVFFLILTPILRVVLSFVSFLRERDWIYVGVTSIVLASLTWSLVLR